MSKKEKWETPLEKEQRENKLISFSERWEEELKEKLFNLDKSNEQEIHTVIQEPYEWHNPHPDQEWDVPITEEIKYFDPELSYELTGYRPITMEKGLDFEPDLFRERAITYERKHNYTEYPAGTKPYSDFWNEEYKRCQEGLTIGKYRITGDHYFFLNYYRMEVIRDDAISGAGREESFPSFLAKQYEFFHYVEMCERLSKDICLLKARGIGASEMLASLAVRPYTTNRGYHVMLTCKDEAKLDPLREKCWRQLDWLNLNTQGGMRHVRQAINNREVKRASIKTQDGIEYGWKSQITTIIGDNANKIRGSRTDRLIYDECFGAGTQVLMSDYSRKSIENIIPGDFVMGVDGTPQEVESVCSGIDNLYLVEQNKGDSYVINSKHKIYTEFRPRIGGKPDIVDLITAPEYLELSDYYKRTHYGIKSSGLIRSNRHLEYDPYYFGLWLGDGLSAAISIVVNETDDPEIKDFVLNYYNKLLETDSNSHITITKNNSKTTKSLKNYYYSSDKKCVCNKFRQWFKDNNLLNNKHIPSIVMDLCMEDRLKILAGIIDTDGNLKKSSNSYSFSYEIAMSRKTLILQIGELAKSCGFYVSYNERRMPNGYKKGSNSYRVVIHGDLRRIPVLVDRKKLPDDYQETSNKLSGRIHISYKGIGNYYGFKLKSYGKEYDHLFLLSDFTIVHNCGSNDILTDSWIKGDALVSLGGKRFGVKLCAGTGGDTFSLTGLTNMFSNPEAYNILPYKNYDTDDGKPELVSFFIPAHKFALTSKYLDNRGVTNYPELKKYFLKVREKLTDKDYLSECAEHCFTPREALSKHGDNIFDSVVISERMIQIKVHGDYIKPKPMALFWDNTSGVKKVRAAEHPDSKLLVVEPPVLDEQGQPFKNLYVAGIDAIDMGKAESATDYDVSDFCVVIKKRQFGQNPPKYVAIYKDRPNNIREAFEITMRLLVWYNCKALLEQTKFSIQTYFKEHNMGHYFMPRPKVALAGGIRNPKKQLMGLQATPAMIQHGLELIQNFLNDYWYTIDFEDMLDELLNYSYENKRKFDMIAAMICAEIGDEDMTGLSPTVLNTIKNQWRDIGYYIDENGYRRWGVIPNDRNWKTN